MEHTGKITPRNYGRYMNAGLVVTLAAFVGIGVLAYRSITGYLQNSSSIARSDVMHEHFDDFLSSLKDVQRGTRGYIITRNARMLEPVPRGSDMATRSINELRKRVAPGTPQAHTIDVIASLSDRLLNQMAREVESTRQGAADSAVAIVGSGTTTQIMENIENGVRKLEDEEKAREAGQRSESDANLRDSLIALGGSAGFTILVIVGIFFAMNRQLRARMVLTEDLQRSEQRLQNVINSIHEGLTFSNSQGGFEIYNRRMRELTGYTMEEANRAGDFARLIYPDPVEHQQALDGVKLLIESPGIHQNETTITTKAGERKVLHVTSQMIGTVKRKMFLTTFEDITDRKRIEEALSESERKFRLVFENAFDGISIFEEREAPEKRRLVECNPRYADFSGRSREELLKLGVTEDLARFFDQTESKAPERPGAYSGLFSWLRPDGKENFIEFNAVPIVLHGKRFTIGIDRDVTDRKRAEADREKLIGELQKALADVKTLSGLVPICASCKKIRDDGGYWTQLEAFLQARTDAHFTHGICPDCAERLYPGHGAKNKT